jgi:fructose-bisphosphate aldolase class II
MPLEKLSNNRAVKMLEAARKGRYGVLGIVTYNMETLVAIIKAAEAKRSPVQILLFPWAYKYSPLFIEFCAHACRRATVPVTIHMDHVYLSTHIHAYV